MAEFVMKGKQAFCSHFSSHHALFPLDFHRKDGQQNHAPQRSVCGTVAAEVQWHRIDDAR